jgi:hypothetical protein
MQGCEDVKGGTLFVFTEKGSGQLQVAYCDGGNGPCYHDPTSSWYSFGGPYKSTLNRYALPGVAAAAGSDVRGMFPGEWLYVAMAEQGTGHIRVVVLGADNDERFSFEIPDRYPSHTTNAPMGIEVRRAAFPSQINSNPKNYVYLTWTDPSSGKLVMSVLRNPSERFKFTRTVDTFRTPHPGTGASFIRGQPVDYHILPVWLGRSNKRAYSAHLYGRY